MGQEQDGVAVSALALSGDESLLIVRASHSERLSDAESSSSSSQSSTVISQLLVVDVVSAQLVATVGAPLRSVTPPDAEFLADTSLLLVTAHVTARQAAAAAAASGRLIVSTHSLTHFITVLLVIGAGESESFIQTRLTRRSSTSDKFTLMCGR